jgi:hypothetical protein
MNEEQHVVGGETSPGEHFNGEEVGIYKDRHVGGAEILPGSILAPLGRRQARASGYPPRGAAPCASPCRLPARMHFAMQLEISLANKTGQPDVLPTRALKTQCAEGHVSTGRISNGTASVMTFYRWQLSVTMAAV